MSHVHLPVPGADHARPVTAILFSRAPPSPYPSLRLKPPGMTLI